MAETFYFGSALIYEQARTPHKLTTAMHHTDKSLYRRRSSNSGNRPQLLR